MSQSLYTAMGGIASATTQLSVISNNVANINTTAFKASSVEFSDVYSTTLSYGSVSTSTSGGTNPKQIGVGVEVSAISTDFNTGSWVSTGKSTDLMINGNGFFTVEATDGSTYYTRAGDFSIDANGNLVTSNGYKVEGTDSILAATSSGETVKIPTSIVVDQVGNVNVGTKLLTDLNNTKPITTGNFTISTRLGAGAPVAHTISLSAADTSGSVANLAAAIQTDLGTPAATGVTVGVSNGQITFTVDNVVSDTISFSTPTGGSNFVTTTEMNNSVKTGNVYASKILDYTVNISDITSANAATSVNSTTINEDGSIEVNYKNGGTLSVEKDSSGANYQFVYTSPNDVKIAGLNCTVAPNIAVPANFVIQMATITNTEGLVSVGSNMYASGPNTGDIVYTVAGEMGTGKVAAGGLEASNVDLSRELSNMILAQRAIQANSRVFTTTSNVMDVVTQMGR